MGPTCSSLKVGARLSGDVRDYQMHSLKPFFVAEARTERQIVVKVAQ